MEALRNCDGEGVKKISVFEPKQNAWLSRLNYSMGLKLIDRRASYIFSLLHHNFSRNIQALNFLGSSLFQDKEEQKENNQRSRLAKRT
jgi:hypothetical protein